MAADVSEGVNLEFVFGVDEMIAARATGRVAVCMVLECVWDVDE